MFTPCKLSGAALIAGALFGMVPSAFAEGLGDLRVKSHLGETFRAEIDVLGMRPTFSAECLVLDPSLTDPPSGLPRLRDVSLTLDTASQRIRISSRQRINEPAMLFSLTLVCGSHVTREYVILLSPQEMAGVPADTPVVAREVVAPLATTRKPPARPPAGRTKPAGQALPAKPAPVVAPPPAAVGGDAVRPPTAAASTTPGERLELAPATVDLAQIEKEIADLNAELRRLGAGSETQSPATQTRILELETRLVRMEMHAARARMLSQSPPAAAASPVPAGEPAVAPAMPTAPSPPPVAAPKPASEAAPGPRRADSDDAGSGIGLGMGVLAVLAAAGGGLYLARRNRRERPVSPASSLRAELAVPPSALTERRQEPANAGANRSPAAAADSLPTPVAVPEFTQRMAEPAELSPEAEVLKLAEVMSAFGRIDGAIDALRAYIRENPDNALRPTLYLLKLHKEQGNRDAFEVVAASLRGKPGCGGLNWDDPVDELQRLIAAGG